MKKWIMILCTLLFFFPGVVLASTNTEPRTEDDLKIRESIEVTNANIDDILTTPKVNEEEKIYDFADLFSDSEETDLYFSVENFIHEHDLDMIILTINENNKASAQRYAQDFFSYNYFGMGDTLNGLVFILDVSDRYNREVAIVTSGTAMLYYDNARLDNILDEIYPELRNNNFYSATSLFITESSKYAGDVPASNEGYIIDENGDMIKMKTVNWLVTLGGAFGIALIVTLIVKNSYKMVKVANDANSYIDGTSIKYEAPVDQFITSHTSRVYIDHSSSSSGGSRRGGSSISRGSSGRSFGGSSRRF